MDEAQDGMKRLILEGLQNTQSMNKDVREDAEQKLKYLEVMEDFGAILTELTVDEGLGIDIRQLSSVLLKQYIETHWHANANKFQTPEVTPENKAKVRALLPRGLACPSSKVRSSVAHALSSIAAWDWPVEWPQFYELVLAGLRSDSEAGQHGALRVLTEVSRDNDCVNMRELCSVVLPEMYEVFRNTQKYNVRFRARAVEIYTNFAKDICSMGEYDKNQAKTLLYPSLGPFLETMMECLAEKDQNKVDCGMRKNIFKALSMLVSSSPRQMKEYLPKVLTFAWATLATSAPHYVSGVVNSEDYTDSDGETVGFDSVLYSLLDFIESLLTSSHHRELIKTAIPDLLYYLLFYMELTNEQMEAYADDANGFVEFEDDQGYTFSVRSSANQLFTCIFESMSGEFGQGLISACSRHIQRGDQERAAGNPNWWKAYEVVLHSVSLGADTLLGDLLEQEFAFDVYNFIEVVVKPSIQSVDQPYLCARALFCGSTLCVVMPRDALDSLTHFCVALHQHPVVRVSAVRAQSNLLELFDGTKAKWLITLLKENDALFEKCPFPNRVHDPNVLASVLQPYLPTLVDSLVSCTTQSSGEMMALCLERLVQLLDFPTALVGPFVGKVSSLCLAVFIKSNHDHLLSYHIQELLEELCKHDTRQIQQGSPGSSLTTIQKKFFPTLVSVLNTPPDKTAQGAQAAAMDMLAVLVRHCADPGADTLMLGVTFPAVVNRLLNTDDLSTQQNGGECVRAFVCAASPALMAWTDGAGRGGLAYVMEVCSVMLNPSASDEAASFTGRLVCSLIKNASEHLGENFELLLRFCLSKLASTTTLLVIQNLLVVFSQLIHSRLEEVLRFLCSVPGPEGESGLQFVLTTWCARQANFCGAYERKVTSLALLKLLEHAVLTDDTRLQGFTVPGDQVIPAGAGVRTRSHTTPVQWTEVPVLVKIFKLIIYELSDALEAAEAGDEGEGDEEEEGWEDDEDTVLGETSRAYVTSDMLDERIRSAVLANKEDSEDCDDPEAASDPINALPLAPLLTAFLERLSAHPAYSVFTPHLNPHERETLTAVSVGF